MFRSACDHRQVRPFVTSEDTAYMLVAVVVSRVKIILLFDEWELLYSSTNEHLSINQFSYLSICLSVYLSIYGSTALVDLDPFFSLLIYTQSVGSVRSKAITCTKDSTNTELTHRDIHGSSGIRSHDTSAWAGEDSTRFRPRGHCDLLRTYIRDT
jgi:hypothetical protein